jgi:FSR family fosmidomycin resistance protein-like MFS transporter
MSSSNPALVAAATAKPHRLAGFGVLTFVLLCMGHFAIDLSSAALGGLQPVLRDRFGISLTQAGILGGVFVFSASLLQPLYGWLADRTGSRLFTVLSPLLASSAIALLRFAPDYFTIMALVFVAGVGIAAFHPQGTSLAVRGVEYKRGRAMAAFISSGTLGFAIGPSFYAALVTAFGFESLPWSILPGAIGTLLLWIYLPRDLQPVGDRASRGGSWEPIRRVWKPITLLFLLVFIRSTVQVTFAQLLPLYLNVERSMSLVMGNYLVSAYLVCGAMGGFLGGTLADRFGGKRVILWSMLGTTPCLLVFFLTNGWLSALGLCLGGAVLLFTIPVNVLMAQELAPSQTATVSSLMMGFAWGVAGLLFVPLTGWLADHIGMHDALMLLLVFPLLGAVVTTRLPNTLEEQRRM